MGLCVLEAARRPQRQRRSNACSGVPGIELRAHARALRRSLTLLTCPPARSQPCSPQPTRARCSRPLAPPAARPAPRCVRRLRVPAGPHLGSLAQPNTCRPISLGRAQQRCAGLGPCVARGPELSPGQPLAPAVPPTTPTAPPLLTRAHRSRSSRPRTRSGAPSPHAPAAAPRPRPPPRPPRPACARRRPRPAPPAVSCARVPAAFMSRLPAWQTRGALLVPASRRCSCACDARTPLSHGSAHLLLPLPPPCPPHQPGLGPPGGPPPPPRPPPPPPPPPHTRHPRQPGGQHRQVGAAADGDALVVC
jgi:hypothetical protein